MAEPEQKQEAPQRTREVTSASDLEVTTPISTADREKAIGGIGDLGKKAEADAGFKFDDPSTWGNLYGQSRFAEMMRGTSFASAFQNFGRTVDGGVETQDGQVVDDQKVGENGKKKEIVAEGGSATPADKTEKAKSEDRTKVDDKVQTNELTKEGILKDYAATLVRAGFSEAEAQKIADNTYARFDKAAKDGHLKGRPEEQMKRMDTAHREILDKQPGGTLADGQKDYLTAADRQNIVKDSAIRTENPEKYVNQGQHMTCALHSIGKQELEAGDPAKVAERTRDLVNNGFTTAKEQDRRGLAGEIIPGKERVVHVDSLSLKPDREASNTVNSRNYGDNGKQGPAGQVYAAFAGQLAADLKSEREGGTTSAGGIENASNVYMAAHADERGARARQTSTNEGMFSRDSKGNLKYEGDGPQVNIWDVAHLNRAVGGADGAVFASTSLFKDGKGNTPPPGYPPDLKISTFRNTDELRQKLGDFQKETGQSGQIGVNAPFLPGGGRNGHGMHAMNISLNADGSFKLDNNWGSKNDLGRVSDRDVDIATNKANWNVQGGGGGRVPDDGTRFGPSTGRNPNENDHQFKEKQDDEKRKKEDEEKARQLEKQQEKEREGKLLDIKQRAEMQYAKDMQAYELAAERARAQGVPNPMARPVQATYV